MFKIFLKIEGLRLQVLSQCNIFSNFTPGIRFKFHKRKIIPVYHNSVVYTIQLIFFYEF